ncbi:unnamed protein product [Coccothraustes coccothraustes]
MPRAVGRGPAAGAHRDGQPWERARGTGGAGSGAASKEVLFAERSLPREPEGLRVPWELEWQRGKGLEPPNIIIQRRSGSGRRHWHRFYGKSKQDQKKRKQNPSKLEVKHEGKQTPGPTYWEVRAGGAERRAGGMQSSTRGPGAGPQLSPPLHCTHPDPVEGGAPCPLSCPCLPTAFPLRAELSWEKIIGGWKHP